VAPLGGTLIVAPLSVLEAVWARELASKVFINQSILSIERLIHESVNQSVNQSINQPTNHTSNPFISTDWPCASTHVP